MKILVTSKRVTDPDAQIKLKPDLTDIETQGLEFKINPFDENAIEASIQLQQQFGGEIIAVTIGPEESTQYLRTALAMGADRGIRVEGNDRELDSDLVARTLAKIAEREKPDLIILGKQAIDGDSNQVGQLLAEYLHIGQATFANKIEYFPDTNTVHVRREVDGGLETLELKLPAVITADLRLNEPRYPTLPGIMKAKKKPVQVLTMGELGIEPTLKIKTLRYENPPKRQAGIKVATVDDLIEKLKNEAKVLPF